MALTKVQNTGIADDAVTTDKIENSTVIAADIAPGTIANAKLSNSAVTINGSSVSLGGSASIKHIEWQALTVADGSTTLTAEAGKGYFLDTNVGVIEVFLPSSPSRGDTFVFADYGGTFGTNQLIINTGGQLIDSTTGPDFKVTTDNAIVELVYVDANKGYLVKLNQAAGTTPGAIATGIYGATFIQATGGTVTQSGDYKIHTFTGDGNFIVSSLGSGIPTAEASNVDYLVVAGGGGAGTGSNVDTQAAGGGGGAGGYREGKDSTASSPHTASPAAATSGITVTATTFPISVGGGGAGGAQPGPFSSGFVGSDGSNSVFSTITSAGGGNGARGGPSPGGDGGPGGSGGGAGANNCTKGNGNTPPVSPPQGNNGSNGASDAGGGGGGIGAAATNACNTNGADGGAGLASSITGSSVTRGGGGGGAGETTKGCGGAGGGGNGFTNGSNGPGSGVAGTANTGGGGGGAYSNSNSNPTAGGAGGKGVVILRYKFIG